MRVPDFPGPAYLAGATTAPSAAPAVGPAAVGARSVPVAPAAPVVGARSAEDEEAFYIISMFKNTG